MRAQEGPKQTKRLLITVHGIRTSGEWQEVLGALLKKQFGPALEVWEHKIRFFSLIAFLVPPTRWIARKHFRERFLSKIRECDWSRIDVVAHSFGTYLVGQTLRGLKPSERPAIHTMIFAGAVLKEAFPVHELLTGCVRRLVNDCGIRDWVLIVNKFLVLGMGAAGRFGFEAGEDERFRNRYFKFGHSGYFRGDFMAKYWLPLLVSESGFERHNEWKSRPLETLRVLLLRSAEPVKIVFYCSLVLAPLWYVGGLRKEMLALRREVLQGIDALDREKQKGVALTNAVDQEKQKGVALTNAIDGEESARRRAEIDTEIEKARALGLEMLEAPSVPTLQLRQSLMLDVVQKCLAAKPEYLPREALDQLKDAFAFEKPVLRKPFVKVDEISATDDLDYAAAADNGDFKSFRLYNFDWVQQGSLYAYLDTRERLRVWQRKKSAFLAIFKDNRATVFTHDWTKDPGRWLYGIAVGGLSPKGDILATIDTGHVLRISTVLPSGELRSVPLPSDFKCAPDDSEVRFSDDGKRVGARCGTSLLVMNWREGPSHLAHDVHVFALHPKEDVWAVANNSGIELRSPTGTPLIIPRPPAVRGKGSFSLDAMSFSADGRILATIQRPRGTQFSSSDDQSDSVDTQPASIVFFDMRNTKLPTAFHAYSIPGADMLQFGRDADAHHLLTFGRTGVALHYVLSPEDWSVEDKRDDRSAESTVRLFQRWLYLAKRSQWSHSDP